MKLPLSHFIIRGTSMMPNYKPGAHVFSFNWGAVSVGDVVVTTVKGRLLIKRITKMDQKRVFLAGDNTNQSTDSRSFGWIDRKLVVGKVIWKYP